MSHFKSFRRKHLQVNETILFSIPAFFLGVVIITNMRLAIYDAGGYRFAMDCSSSRLRTSL